jgi:hypothetical protein
MSAEKLAEALRKVDGCEDFFEVQAIARAALAAYEAEAKAALPPIAAEYDDLCKALQAEANKAGDDNHADLMRKAAEFLDIARAVGLGQEATIKRLKAEAAPVNPSPTPAPLTDEQVAAALEAGGIGVQRFMGGISGTKDCWSTQGSADIRKVAAVVRGLIANGAKP